jgi:hypothetical protein
MTELLRQYFEYLVCKNADNDILLIIYLMFDEEEMIKEI